MLHVYVTGQFRPLAALGVRTASTTPSTNAAAAVADPNPGALYQRPVRQEPGKVRLGFVPEEWFQFFYKKTGVTGPYTFFLTFGTYLISKEIYVMEHEFYNGLSFLIMWIVGVKKLGPALAKWLDKEIDVRSETSGFARCSFVVCRIMKRHGTRAARMRKKPFRPP